MDSTPAQSEWLEISLQANPALHDPLSSFLFDLGCAGVVSEDFQDRTLRAYLPLQFDLEEIRARIDLYLHGLKEIFPDIPTPAIQFRNVENEDWGLNWRRFFRPARVTPELLILPCLGAVAKNRFSPCHSHGPGAGLRDRPASYYPHVPGGHGAGAAHEAMDPARCGNR